VSPAIERLRPRTSFLQKLILRHLFPYAGRVKFALAPARPPTAAENPNKGVTELRIDIPPGGDSVRIAVLLTPQGERWPAEQEPPRLTPGLRW